MIGQWQGVKIRSDKFGVRPPGWVYGIGGLIGNEGGRIASEEPIGGGLFF